VTTIAALGEAFKRAEAAPRTAVISLEVDAFEGWTSEGHTWWEIGTPQVSNRPEVLKARQSVEAGRKRQRVGV
jgi:3D-(3,5/4)-trihydroxycyclohexane-1,2-dione acylhydrolase (decyclizing)